MTRRMGCAGRRPALWLLAVVLLASACERGAAAPASPAEPAPATPPGEAPVIHGLSVKRLDGSEVSLSAWAGKVVLVVNTASECGYTPQYAGLQALHTKYQERGFAVLGFPSNDFGAQEPGSAAQIASFCQKNFGVTFPMFDKVSVIGASRAPLYALLADAKGEPRWNFHKYLVDKRGRPVQAWPSKVEPSSDEIARAIERELTRP
jgi:glutathione peroxidase